MVENGNGEVKRWNDRFIGWTVMLIGALSAILWALVWSGVSNAQGRLSELEGDKRVIQEQLKSMNEKLDRIERHMQTK